MDPLGHWQMASFLSVSFCRCKPKAPSITQADKVAKNQQAIHSI